MVSRSAKLILGIDPGLGKTGWGLIKFERDAKYVDCGVISTSTADNIGCRLSKIFDGVCELIASHRPTDVAMEKVFVNVNPKASEKLIMARTAAFLAASKSGFMINEYNPNEVKKNVTGSGHATKLQIYKMVQNILKVSADKMSGADQADALAIALCCAFARRLDI